MYILKQNPGVSPDQCRRTRPVPQKKEDESRGFPGCEYAIFLHQSIQNRPLPGQGSGILGVFLGALHISAPRGHRPILHTMYNMYCRKSQAVDHRPRVAGGVIGGKKQAVDE